MSNVIDGHIDRLVKARWMAIGVSQSDLAEVLGAALQQAQQDVNGSDGAIASRLMQVADALDIPVELFQSRAEPVAQQEPDPSPAQSIGPLHSLLELRLLKAFGELRDQRTKLMLIHLAEQIVKRQANRGGDGG